MTNGLTMSSVGEYLNRLVPPRPDEMQKMEAYGRKVGFPIIGPVAGYHCYQLARMIGAKQIVELGSGYGYSTAWFAKAVKENGGGVVHHVVWDQGLSQKARGHMEALGYADVVEYHVGEAVETLRGMPGPYDLIFNDIDKEGYPGSLSVIEEKLRPGGLLIVDNAIWSGRVFEDSVQESSTQAIREFTDRITKDPGWITTIVPVRDGLLVGYRVAS